MTGPEDGRTHPVAKQCAFIHGFSGLMFSEPEDETH